MTAENIINALKEKFGDKILETDIEVIDPSARIEASAVKEICEFLKNDPSLKFNYLACLSSVDHDEENLRVVYHLDSIEFKHKIVIDLLVPKASPNIPSVTSVWKTADWHEREAYDMMGVTFDGHPDHRRILCPEDWEGFPLRKDYVVQEYYNGILVPNEKREPETDVKDNA